MSINKTPTFLPLTLQYAGNTLRWQLTIEGNNPHHSHPTKRKERQQYDIMKETPTLVFHVKQQNAQTLVYKGISNDDKRRK